MVTRRDAEVQSYRRVAYQIARRTVALQFTPAPGSRAKDLRALPSPAGVDPWGVDPAALPSASEALCTCPVCAGAKKVACPTCGAVGRVPCEECGGVGKVRGQRGVKNCPGCRGQGARKCGACTKGMVECQPCGGVGRVRAWLELREQTFVQVRAHPLAGVAALHKRLLVPEDLDRPPSDFRVPLAEDSQWIDPLPERLGPELGPELDAVAERVRRMRIQRFASTVYRFTYATRSSEGHVSVSGEPPAALPDSAWGPLWRRLAVVVGAAAGMFFAGGVVVGNYVQRAPWFATEGNAGPMTWLVLVATLATGIACAGQWKPAAVRRPLRSSISAWIVAAAWVLLVACWHVGGPTLAEVERAIERGTLAAAQAEIDALMAVGETSPQLAEVRARLAAAEAAEQQRRALAADEVHLAEVRDAPFAAEALERLGRPWNTPEVEAQARELVLRRAAEELAPRTQAEEDAALERLADLLKQYDASLAAQARVRGHLARASKARKRANFAAAVAEVEGLDTTGDEAAAALLAGLQQAIDVDLRRAIDDAPLEEGDLSAQRQTAAAALANARLFESRTGASASHTADALQLRLDRLEKAIERERERAEEAERRRLAAEERARKKAEAAEQRRQAAEAQAAARQARLADRVRCCDGSLSPSCRYSQGSLRGCCSYHGGVC